MGDIAHASPPATKLPGPRRKALKAPDVKGLLVAAAVVFSGIALILIAIPPGQLQYASLFLLGAVVQFMTELLSLRRCFLEPELDCALNTVMGMLVACAYGFGSIVWLRRVLGQRAECREHPKRTNKAFRAHCKSEGFLPVA